MATNAELEPDKRNQLDRREPRTSRWNAFLYGGQRTRNRRAEEHRQPYFVDRFPALTLAYVVLLLAFSMVDAVITLYLLDLGYAEINPVMGHLLKRGLLPFLLGKYVLTAAGLPVLLIFNNYYLFGTRFRVSYLIPLFVSMYVGLLGYELYVAQAHLKIDWFGR
jgi:uncharacterized metal-binding protein